MAAMIGKAALELDWTHHATERSEEIRVFATLFDGEFLSIWFSSFYLPVAKGTDCRK